MTYLRQLTHQHHPSEHLYSVSLRHINIILSEHLYSMSLRHISITLPEYLYSLLLPTYLLEASALMTEPPPARSRDATHLLLPAPSYGLRLSSSGAAEPELAPTQMRF